MTSPPSPHSTALVGRLQFGEVPSWNPSYGVSRKTGPVQCDGAKCDGAKCDGAKPPVHSAHPHSHVDRKALAVVVLWEAAALLAGGGVRRVHADGGVAAATWAEHRGSFAGHVVSPHGDRVGRVQLVRRPEKKRALLVTTAPVHDHARAMFLHLRDSYQEAGYEVTLAPGVVFPKLLKLLANAAAAQQPYSRLILIGHGWGESHSWRPEAEAFERFVAALRAGMTPSGKILSSCHGGGDSKAEARRWVLDLARRTGRTVAAPMRPLRARRVVYHGLAILEGSPKPSAPFHVASHEGARSSAGGGAHLLPAPKLVDLHPDGKKGTHQILDPLPW